MAPRREGEDEGVLVTGGSPPSFPKLDTTPVSSERARSISFVADYADEENFETSLYSSLERLSERGAKLLDEVDDSVDGSGKSLIKTACTGSLRNHIPAMVDDAYSLIEYMAKGPTHIMSWRASQALLHLDTYLEVIEDNVKTPCRDPVESQLVSFVDSVASRFASTEGQHVDSSEDVGVCISSWTLPKLGFDVTVGRPVQFVSSKGGLPLKLEVRAISEFLEDDLVNGSSIPEAFSQVCVVHVERCVHEPCSYSGISGALGEALVRVQLSQVGPRKRNSGAWREDKNDVKRLYVREARTVQVNAVPPKPKTTVDLYASSSHGESNITLTMRFHTYKTSADDTPDVRVELVMG